MALEVPVRKEISTFESRPAFGLTARQLVTLGFALPLGIGAYFLFYNLMGSNAGSTAAIIATIPIFGIGLFKKNGYPIEKYLPIIFAHRYTQQKLVYKTDNAVFDFMTEEEKQADLSTRILNGKPRHIKKAEEVTIFYRPNPKRDRQNMKEARAICNKEAAAFKAELRQIQRQAHKGQGGAAAPPEPEPAATALAQGEVIGDVTLEQVLSQLRELDTTTSASEAAADSVPLPAVGQKRGEVHV